MYLLLGLVSGFLSSLFLVPLSSKSCLFHRSMFVSLFSFEFVTLPPSFYFNLCIVWSCVSYYIDILVLTPHFVSRRLLSCLLSLYHDLYLITWLRTGLFDYDFELVQLNHYFHYIVHLGPHSLSLSLTTRNKRRNWGMQVQDYDRMQDKQILITNNNKHEKQEQKPDKTQNMTIVSNKNHYF